MTDLDFPVFHLNPLKKLFYNFLAAILIISFASISIIAVSNRMNYQNVLEKINGWILFALLFGFSFLYNRRNNADLKKIIETGDLKTKYDMYHGFYKKRLVWSAFSVFISALFFVLTMKNIFFYVLAFQVILSFVLYPRRITIAKELRKEDIVFS